jgi:hypothetical protein
VRSTPVPGVFWQERQKGSSQALRKIPLSPLTVGLAEVVQIGTGFLLPSHKNARSRDPILHFGRMVATGKLAMRHFRHATPLTTGRRFYFSRLQYCTQVELGWNAHVPKTSLIY